ncbi:MAG: tetratricopeptide repeat protein, partial [Planctomycetes bacterium]|nr:tetratricopeptide repeat protein [Planctomycetota bacterium]
YYTGMVFEVIAEGERAVALAPNSADIAGWMGAIYNLSNRPEEAIPCAKRAMRLSPLPQAAIFYLLGIGYRMSARYEEAIASYKEALALDAEFIVSRMALAASYCFLGK